MRQVDFSAPAIVSTFWLSQAFTRHSPGLGIVANDRYTLMAEDVVKSAGAKAPAITFLIDDSPQAMEDLMQSYLFIGAGRRTHSLDDFG